MHPFQEEKSFTLGKFRVTPLTRSDDPAGPFQAVVSLRSGQGRESTDRVYRFHPSFPSRALARRYAAREGALLARLSLAAHSLDPQTQETPWPKRN
jgi:hypothetical protein